MDHSVETQGRTAAENILVASGSLDGAKEQTELRLEDGGAVRIPTAWLLEQMARSGGGINTEREAAGDAGSMVIPIVEEQLQVGKRTVATGKVVLEKGVQEYSEALDVPLAVRTFDIERTVLNRPVETAPPVRQEGETTVYSLVEEQLVLTTQLILKEEVRVTKREVERRDTRTVTLRRDTLSVTRSPVGKEG